MMTDGAFHRSARGHRLVLCPIVAGLLVLAAPHALRAQCPDGTPLPCRGLAPRGAAGPPRGSIAVLYLETRDTADAYLADGLTEEIATSLGRVGQLQVKSPSAVRRAQRQAVGDLRAIGRMLNVSWVVEGSVRRGEGQIRVSVRLVNVANETATWSDAFSRPTSGLLGIEEDIARHVATNVAGVLAPAERTRLARRPTRNPEAYDHLLRGNYLLARRTPETVTGAIDEYAAAARIDPAFVEAEARIAYAYGVLVFYEWESAGAPRESLLARGFRAADRALTLDSTNAGGWLARGVLLQLRDPLTEAGAIAALEKAVALDPRNAEAHHEYAVALFLQGDFERALESERRALAIDPGRTISYLVSGTIASTLRRWEEARRAYDSALAIDPGFYSAYVGRSRLRLIQHDVEGAGTDAEAALRASPPGEEHWGLSALAEVAVARGDTAAALGLMERATAPYAGLGRVGVYTGGNLALGWLACGRTSTALDWLERMEPRGLFAWTFMQRPSFDPLRDAPRFRQLEAAMRPTGVR